MQHIKSIDKPAHGLLSDVLPAGVRNGMLVLHFKFPGHVNMIEGDKSARNTKRRALLTAIERTFGVSNPGIICEVRPPEQAVAPVAPLPEASEEGDLPDPFAVPDEDAKPEVLDVVLDEFPGSTVVDE
jgi:hypothetical protein